VFLVPIIWSMCPQDLSLSFCSPFRWVLTATVIPTANTEHLPQFKTLNP
jgi:hypothetical protein